MQWQLGRASGQGAALRKVLAEKQERKDQITAERGQRIMQSEVWEKDFFPMISALHDRWLAKVKAGEAHIDSLKSLDDLVTLIDGSVQIGAGAMNRIAERRLKASEIKQHIEDIVAAQQ